MNKITKGKKTNIEGGYKMLEKKDYSVRLNAVIEILNEISEEERAIICEMLHDKYHLTYIAEK